MGHCPLHDVGVHFNEGSCLTPQSNLKIRQVQNVSCSVEIGVEVVSFHCSDLTGPKKIQAPRGDREAVLGVSKIGGQIRLKPQSSKKEPGVAMFNSFSSSSIESLLSKSRITY